MRVIVFSYGDPRNPATWSNVPYYAVRTLESMGHEVYCVDFGPRNLVTRTLSKLFNKCTRFVLGKDTLLLTHTLPIWKKRNNDIVKKAIRDFPDTDLLLFMSFSITGANVVKSIPSIMFCDFTIEYTITELQQRNVKWYEQILIRDQDRLLRETDAIVSMFPKATNHFRTYYGMDNIYSLPGHIINCDRVIDDPDELVERKRSSRTLLFVGRRKYLKGALSLINAVRIYNSKNHEKLEVAIIGMTAEELSVGELSWVRCYGVLNKAVDKENQEYYRLIEEAKLIINTTKNWAGMSSMVEAMWLYTPVITTAYSEFVELFGSDLDCGSYCEPEDAERLQGKIEEMLSLTGREYAKIAFSAHRSVEQFTWKNCIDYVLKVASGIHEREN